jgi:tRNA dimethylallyltransferase
VLHERIARRFDDMMAAGFLDEVIGLRRSQDLSARHPSMRAVGYRQLWAHLDGQFALEEGVRRAVAATRQLAKRQLTWMRGEALGEWIDPDSQLSWNRDICHELARLGL